MMNTEQYVSASIAPKNIVRTAIWGALPSCALIMFYMWFNIAWIRQYSSSPSVLEILSNGRYWSDEIIVIFSLILVIGCVTGGISGAFQKLIFPRDSVMTIGVQLKFFTMTYIVTFVTCLLITTLTSALYELVNSGTITSLSLGMAFVEFYFWFIFGSSVFMLYPAHRYLDAHCFPIERKAKNNRES